MRTISEIVRTQILMEGPQIMDPWGRMVYVNRVLDAMNNTELLDRISDAIALQSDREGK